MAGKKCYNENMLEVYTCKTYAEILKRAGEKVAAFGKDLNKKLFAFCEDKLTMSLEREVAKACNGGTFNVQVLSLSRFIRRFSREKGVVLNKESSAMAVKNILLNLSGSLVCFKKSAYNPGTAVALYEMISQLKSANVSPDDLKNGAKNLSGALKGKIEDIITVYNEYESYLSREGFFDSNSYLALMPEMLRGGDFNGCSAMMVGFGSLTRQGTDIVKALAARMENLSVFILAGDNEDMYTNELKTLLMREIGAFSLYESTEKYGAEREKIIDGLFSATYGDIPKTETDKIEVYEAADYDDEVRRIASVIRKSVVDGMRYRDIAVAVGGAEGYYNSLERIFGDYEIPFFIDRKRPLGTHPMAALTVGYVDLLKGNFAVQDAVLLIKNPYFQEDKRVSDVFENFVLRNAVNRKILKNGLNPTLTGHEQYGSDEEIEIFERERARIFSLEAHPKTVKDYVSEIKKLLVLCDAQNKSAGFSERLRGYGCPADAAFTDQAYEKIETVLDAAEKVLGNAKAEAAEFKNILVSGFEACEVSVLPQLSDAVYVGDYKECKYLEHKILFAAGLSGEVPFAKSDTAVLTDRDLNKLEEFQLIVEPKIRIVNRRERENVGVALASFTEKLYLSRSVTTSAGKPAPKGRIIDFFTTVFTQGGKPLAVRSAVALERLGRRDAAAKMELASISSSAPIPALKDYLAGVGKFKEGFIDDVTAESSYISAVREILPDCADLAAGLTETGGAARTEELEKNAELVFKGRDEISASVLESYFGCPFVCFMRYGLGANERESGEVKVNEYGTLLHAVLEGFVKKLMEDEKSGAQTVRDKETSDALTDEILKERIAEYAFAKYAAGEKYETIFSLVGREARRVCYAVFCQIRDSEFKPHAVEVKFGRGGAFGAIPIETKAGEKKIVGKIDRVDRSGDRVRIIDYKTGTVHDKDEEFYTGNNLQLYLYMNAVAGEDAKPDSAFYFPVNDGFAKEDEDVYALKGNKLTESDIASYVRYAEKIARRGCDEIARGVIAPSPYEGKCKYCAYAGACGFDLSRDAERKEKNVGKKTVIDAAEEEL